MLTAKTIEEGIAAHYALLAKRTAIEPTAGAHWCITVPWLDRHNDLLQFYILEYEGRVRLTDLGHTVSDLGISLPIGATLPAATILVICAGLAVRCVEGNLFVDTDSAGFGDALARLVQAMLAVDSLGYATGGEE
jgi:hypothetical protein